MSASQGRRAGALTLLAGVLACAVATTTAAQGNAGVAGDGNNATLFDFHNVVDIEGRDVNLAKFRGNVSLVINVASFWGETKMSYQGMSKLAKEFAGEPFTILAFPSNQFGGQEPLSNSWIESFVRGNGTHSCGLIYCNWKGYFPYPLFAKCNVKPSWCDRDPSTSCTSSSKSCCSRNDSVWKWLSKLYGDVPKWNFAGKHLFDKCGNPSYYVNDATLDPAKLAPKIRKLLNKDC